MRPRTIGLSAILLVLALAAGALLFSPLRVYIDDPADGKPVRGVSTVRIDAKKFSPPVIEVPVGTTVTWEFADVEDGQPVAHNIQAKDFRSPDTQTGRFKHRFTRPGSFKYRCSIHFAMRGRVVVVAAGDSSR